MPRKKSSTRTIMKITASIAVGLALIRVVLLVVIQEPFQMTVQPTTPGQALVQFRIDDGRVSPEFPVTLRIAKPIVVDLLDEKLPVPGCVVTMYSLFPLPRCFRLRLGGRRFEVRGDRVEADGIVYPGQPR